MFNAKSFHSSFNFLSFPFFTPMNGYRISSYPCKSFARLVLYLLIALELITIYTYALVILVANLFPATNR